MKTLLEKNHKWYVKQYHILCGKLGLDKEAKQDILKLYKVKSSNDLSCKELMDICSKLEKDLCPQLKEMDIWRKRLIASIGAWQKAMNNKSDIKIIKAIACRASEKKTFNEIPLEQLRNLYNAFVKKTKDMKAVEKLTVDELDLITCMN